MRKFTILLLSILLISCDNVSQSVDQKKKFDGIPVIRLDKAAISGVGLNAVTNTSQPNRRLYQKRLVRGNELSVYVVSSETATAQQSNYGMEEFIRLINGRSRMNPANGDEIIFETGDSFIAPKGFTGEWETIGGDEFLIELSVITTERVDGDIDQHSTLPYLIDKIKRSGQGITKASNNTSLDTLYKGIELTVILEGNTPDTVREHKKMQEQVVEVISGQIDVTPSGGETESFFSGDYYLIPANFEGNIKYQGHGLVRSMHIYKS